MSGPRAASLRNAIGRVASLGVPRDPPATDARVAAAEDELRLAVGSLHARAVRSSACTSLADSEFRVFSQFGEDGILQYLIARVPVEEEVFVEFGVGSYRESNTRFLLVENNWRGLVMDGGTAHIEFLEASSLSWRHTVTARSAFITAENVNDEIRAGGVSGDIGLLSVDIDGNDYWVIQALDVVSPRILVAEYNSLFGPTAPVSIPYQPTFDRGSAHYSHLYWGASIAALTHVAEAKGYSLVGSNRAGNNVFFVRNDVLGSIPSLSPQDAWVANAYRDSRAEDGSLSYLTGRAEQLAAIKDMEVVDVRSGTRVRCGELS